MVLMSPALAGWFFRTSATWEAHTAPYTCDFNAFNAIKTLQGKMLYF